MPIHLPARVLRDISGFAAKNHIHRIILFGSRARGTHTERSDIDIAVSGGDFDSFYRAAGRQDIPEQSTPGQHAAILDAIEAKRPEEAASLMRSHIRHTYEGLLIRKSATGPDHGSQG